MATLTATGVTTSNGTLDGYYTGSSGTNTSFPLGSYILSDPQGNYLDKQLNTSVTVGYTTASGYSGKFFTTGGNGGYVTLSGTWVQRGNTNHTCGLVIGFLLQRIA